MLSITPAVLKGVEVHDLQKIKRIVRATFPSARQIDCQTLANWLDESNSTLLVDVRGPEEFAVSHLSGAVHICDAAEIRQTIRKKNPTRTVLYCSVGFRSSRLAAQLSDLKEIYNLEGSIFEWANQGRPLFQNESPASTVHPFGNRWTGLLKEGAASCVD